MVALGLAFVGVGLVAGDGSRILSFTGAGALVAVVVLLLDRLDRQRSRRR
jgi:hypothetical protein